MKTKFSIGWYLEFKVFQDKGGFYWLEIDKSEIGPELLKARALRDKNNIYRIRRIVTVSDLEYL